MSRRSSRERQSSARSIRPEDIELTDTTQADITWALQPFIQPFDQTSR